jgi:ubiquinone/menaquinone biosynthesis C-methylase UbiE
VVGCDLFAFSLAKHRTIRDRVICTLDDLPFADESFTLVTLNMVVEHLTQPDTVLREIARVLNPAGLVVLMTPNRNGYFVRISNVARALIPEKLQGKLIRYLESREPEDVFKTHYLANTRKRLQEIMQAAGLEPRLVSLSRGRRFFYFLRRFLRWSWQLSGAWRFWVLTKWSRTRC